MATPSALLTEIDPSSAVLFLGSGFSLESTNLYGKAPPNGAGLRRYFIEKLGLPSDTSYDLHVLAEEFASESDVGLYRELYNLFHFGQCRSQSGSYLEAFMATNLYDELRRRGGNLPSETWSQGECIFDA